MPFSYTHEQRIFEHSTGKTQWAFKPMSIGLTSTMPDKSAANVTEPGAGNNYQRVQTGPNVWGVYVPSYLVNALPIVFPVVAVADWGTPSVPLVAATFWWDQTDLSPASFAGWYPFVTPITNAAPGWVVRLEAGTVILKNTV
jgi:hypothetical protein